MSHFRLPASTWFMIITPLVDHNYTNYNKQRSTKCQQSHCDIRCRLIFFELTITIYKQSSQISEVTGNADAIVIQLWQNVFLTNVDHNNSTIGILEKTLIISNTELIYKFISRLC